MFRKNGDVYGMSPVINTGSSGLSAPGWTGIGGNAVAVADEFAASDGVLSGSPDAAWHANDIATNKIAMMSGYACLVFNTNLLDHAGWYK